MLKKKLNKKRILIFISYILLETRFYILNFKNEIIKKLMIEFNLKVRKFIFFLL